MKHYVNFVDTMMSDEKVNIDILKERITELDKSDVSISRLIAGAMGMCGEAGEFDDIVKKIIFQRKPISDENIETMRAELGDIMFYWICSCIALNADPEEIIKENINKLTERYPDGFSYNKSENRQFEFDK